LITLIFQNTKIFKELTFWGNYQTSIYKLNFCFIAEQAAEQIIRKKTIISPEDVLTLPKITEGNVYI